MESMNGVMPVYNLADNNYGRNWSSDAGEWIWILLFFVLFGYGGFNGNTNGVTADYLLNQTSRITEQVLTSATGTNQGICDATYAINNSIKDLGTQLAQASNDNRFDAAQGFSTVNFNMNQGFCNTNRNIDNLRYDMAEKFCEVTNNQARDTAAILQAIQNTSCQEQIRDLERRNAEMSQRNQTTTILASVQDMLKDYQVSL